MTPYDPRHIRSVDHVKLYPSASETAGVPRSWDIEITDDGAEGDEWTLEFNGGEVTFTNLAAPTVDTAAAGLRAAAAALVGVTVTGATAHVILTVPALEDVSAQPASAPVLTVDPAGGTSTQAVVSASNVRGFGVTTVDQK